MKQVRKRGCVLPYRLLYSPYSVLHGCSFFWATRTISVLFVQEAACVRNRCRMKHQKLEIEPGFRTVGIGRYIKEI